MSLMERRITETKQQISELEETIANQETLAPYNMDEYVVLCNTPPKLTFGNIGRRIKRLLLIERTDASKRAAEKSEKRAEKARVVYWRKTYANQYHQQLVNAENLKVLKNSLNVLEARQAEHARVKEYNSAH